MASKLTIIELMNRRTQKVTRKLNRKLKPARAAPGSMTEVEFNEAHHKVGVTAAGAMHNNDPLSRLPDQTLCGRTWYFHNDHGDKYCRECQRILAKRRAQILGDGGR